ncbi:unnamed protein product [Rhodiola kirilowii]
MCRWFAMAISRLVVDFFCSPITPDRFFLISARNELDIVRVYKYNARASIISIAFNIKYTRVYPIDWRRRKRRPVVFPTENSSVQEQSYQRATQTAWKRSNCCTQQRTTRF